MIDNNEFYTFNEYIKKNNLTPSEEDYIEMIYRLYLESKHIQAREISEHLNIKPPSVTKMLKKLSDKNLIIYKKYGDVELSNLGKNVGKSLLHRHNVVYEFLEVIGIDNDIHEQTEKIEHTLNIEVVNKINDLSCFIKENDLVTKFREYQKRWD